MLAHKCSTVAFANQIVRFPVTGGLKPLILKGQHDMAAFLAQSPNAIYRASFEVVFP
ncbi:MULTISPECIES: hypothetical protein [Pseudomonas]|jgi:hypothetical protein|uniref:Uncharacterized protein n=1 Tax=Pseudomonas migulae TaxID=78543 RepID=A0ABY8MTA0_9PSED|nr:MULTISPECIES: hypothetical protein [Pseudomonas]MBD9546408.1 hypothetical protein [Pseudomonas sp. PDM01]MBD9612029.1 hypothetical protein [Pseudomonas sp. PDM02]UCP07878.1 hypothetical protein K5R88_18860 [Pseudomonas sp. MM213]WGK90238.1 hypothetical protein MOQ58_27650 [Pseudomonas migulae]